MNQFEKYSINNKLSKTLINHCNACFLALKGLINRLQILVRRLKKNVYENVVPFYVTLKKLMQW